MEEKILYKVLKNVDKGEHALYAPDTEYVKALETIGLIKGGWDTVLTDFGRGMLRHLENKFY